MALVVYIIRTELLQNVCTPIPELIHSVLLTRVLLHVVKPPPPVHLHVHLLTLLQG